MKRWATYSSSLLRQYISFSLCTRDSLHRPGLFTTQCKTALFSWLTKHKKYTTNHSALPGLMSSLKKTWQVFGPRQSHLLVFLSPWQQWEGGVHCECPPPSPLVPHPCLTFNPSRTMANANSFQVAVLYLCRYYSWTILPAHLAAGRVMLCAQMSVYYVSVTTVPD